MLFEHDDGINFAAFSQADNYIGNEIHGAEPVQELYDFPILCVVNYKEYFRGADCFVRLPGFWFLFLSPQYVE